MSDDDDDLWWLFVDHREEYSHEFWEELCSLLTAREAQSLPSSEGRIEAQIVETAAVGVEATAGVSAEHLTSPGAALGTVAYMSPEQVRAK